MFLTLENTRLYATAFGPPSATPFLALSGWIGSWEDWIETFSLLSESHRVISYDHRGSGASIAPAETITLDRLVDDVFAVLDAYQVERCVLMAMSMGAAVALKAVLKQPERFAGLVLVNGLYARAGALDDDPFFLGLQRDYGRTLDDFARLCVPEPDSDHIIRWGRQILDRAAPEAAVALYGLLEGLDLRPDLPRIGLPALVIHGDADPLVPLAAAETWAAALPRGELAVIPGAGHVPIMTRPQAVVDAIHRFLAR